MKTIIYFFLVVIAVGVWMPACSGQPFLQEVIIAQPIGIPGKHRAHQKLPIHALCWVVWAEGIDPRYWRQKPYRNPLRHLRKWIRQLTKEQRRRARTAQRMHERKAKFVGSVFPSVQQPQDRAVMVDEHISARKKQGRSATIPTNHLFCPTKGCRGYRQLGPHPNHWIRGDGKYETSWGQIRQMFECGWCKKSFSETQGTVFFGLKTAEETVYRALACLAEGVSIRSTARVFEVRVETILLWLKRAGEHCEQVSHYLMHNLRVEQAQLDELWTFVLKKERTLSSWEKIHTEYGDTWIWTVVDPVHKLVLAFLIGDRKETQAEGVLKRLVATLAESCLPLLTSDNLPHYAHAILKVFGRWIQPERMGTKGRFPKKRLEAPEGLEYAIVHKEHRKGRVISVKTKVVFGKEEDLMARLRSMGMQKINTSFVERMNLTLRHLVSRLRRKGLTFSKKREFLEWHMHLAVAYYHFVRTHRSLRRPLPEPIPTKGNGSPKKWQFRTPSMSAGLTDHIWTIQELLKFRVPTAQAVYT